MLSVSGCRGIFGTSLTTETVGRFAHALGSWVKAQQQSAIGGKGGKGGKVSKGVKGAKGSAWPMIVVGRDGRAGGSHLTAAAHAGLTAAGCDVLPLDIAMTPTVGFIVDQLGAAGGLVLTASHNPQQWNGLKPVIRPPGLKPGVRAASAPDKSSADAIIARFHATTSPNATTWDAVGEVLPCDCEENILEQHTSHVLGLLDSLGVLSKIKKAKIDVVIDHLGMSADSLDDVLMSELAKSYEFVDEAEDCRGLFPHAAEPLKENLVGLAKAVSKRKAHVGFAQDPDADRLAVVDEKGRYIGEEYTIVLCAMALAELGLIKRKSVVVVNLSTSRMIEDIAALHGATVLRSSVGEANVVALMKQRKAAFGGEGNGGVIWPQTTYIRDSLSGIGLIMGLMAMRKQPLSKIVDSVPRYAIEKRKVDLASKDLARPAIEAIGKAYASERIDLQDGIRVDFDSKRAWLHVRASNTEPIMRLIAEAPEVSTAKAILDEAARVIG